MSQITRAAMVAAIVAGGSVMYGGRIVTKVDDLPGEEDLATTAEEKAAVADDLRGQIGALSARLSKIEGVPSDSEQMGELLMRLQTDNDALNIRLTDAETAHQNDRETLGNRLAAALQENEQLKERLKACLNAPQATVTSPPAPPPPPVVPTAPIAESAESLQSSAGQTAMLSMNGEDGGDKSDAPEVASTPLPADFPKCDQLVAVGIDTVEAVAAKSVEELNAVEGITATTAKAVKAAAETALGK